MLLNTFSLGEMLVLAGTAGAGSMTPPTSTRISARLKCGQGHVSPGSMFEEAPPSQALRPRRKGRARHRNIARMASTAEPFGFALARRFLVLENIQQYVGCSLPHVYY